MGHSCGGTRSSPASVSYETSSQSHASRLQERFVRDFLQKSRVKSPKRAFCTRLPPKVTRQVSKTSISHETSSKSHASSLQTERFVRDFLQKSSGNTHRSTHITQPCQAVSRFHPLQTTSAHSDIHLLPQLTTSRFPCACHESFRVHTSNAHKVLRLPRNVTSVTLRNPHDSLQLPLESHFHASKPAQSPAPATKSRNIISCELQQNLHHTTRLE